MESNTSVSLCPQDGQSTCSLSSLRRHKYSKILPQPLHLNSWIGMFMTLRKSYEKSFLQFDCATSGISLFTRASPRRASTVSSRVGPVDVTAIFIFLASYVDVFSFSRRMALMDECHIYVIPINLRCIPWASRSFVLFSRIIHGAVFSFLPDLTGPHQISEIFQGLIEMHAESLSDLVRSTRSAPQHGKHSFLICL